MHGPQKKPSRLGQWDGPRHSSRGHASLFAGLLRRSVLARVGVVLLATVALTALSYCWGPPFPYRLGEVWAHDIIARVDFEAEDADKTEDAQDAAVKRLPQHLRNDPAACRRVRRAVPPVMESYRQGTMLLQRNQQITESQRGLLLAEARAY